MLTETLLSTLKQVMRRQGISYKDAADALDLSESSIKRLFAEQSFTLYRLEKLLELANMDLGALLQLAELAKQQTNQLTLEQEQEIVNNPKLLLVGICVLNRYSFEDILQKYRINEPELIGLFTKLDKLNIVELLPGNRYRLKISPDFKWQPAGPIQKFFIASFLDECLISEMQASGSHLHFVWGMLSKESLAELCKKIQRLIDDYIQLTANEARLPRQEKSTSSLFVLFREDWEPSAFKAHWQHKHGFK